MANKLTVDLVNKLLIIDAGVTELDAQVDLYSDLKEDWIANAIGEASFTFPMTTTGGDPISATLNVGAYYFLRTDLGWRIRPAEEDHTLTVTGNLYSFDPDLPLFVPTLGNFTVAIQLEKSSLTQTSVSGSGVTAQDKLDIADAVLDEALSGHLADGTLGRYMRDMTAYGIGRIVAGGGDPPTTFTYYALDNTTPLFTLTVGATERTRS
jgi:hypothetical protein